MADPIQGNHVFNGFYEIFSEERDFFNSLGQHNARYTNVINLLTDIMKIVHDAGATDSKYDSTYSNGYKNSYTKFKEKYINEDIVNLFFYYIQKTGGIIQEDDVSLKDFGKFKGNENLSRSYFKALYLNSLFEESKITGGFNIDTQNYMIERCRNELINLIKGNLSEEQTSLNDALNKIHDKYFGDRKTYFDPEVKKLNRLIDIPKYSYNQNGVVLKEKIEGTTAKKFGVYAIGGDANSHSYSLFYLELKLYLSLMTNNKDTFGINQLQTKDNKVLVKIRQLASEVFIDLLDSFKTVSIDNAIPAFIAKEGVPKEKQLSFLVDYWQELIDIFCLICTDNIDSVEKAANNRRDKSIKFDISNIKKQEFTKPCFSEMEERLEFIKGDALTKGRNMGFLDRNGQKKY